jgi:hypothetical protein
MEKKLSVVHVARPQVDCHVCLLSDDAVVDGDDVFHPQYGIGRAWLDGNGVILISYDHNNPGNRANDSVTLSVASPSQKKIIINTGKNTKEKVPLDLIFHLLRGPKEVILLFKDVSGPLVLDLNDKGEIQWRKIE